jgi:uncharacterized protein with ParB-like and HNH nuclease domain
MNTSSISLKPINALLGESFYIPAYQRGYRWNKQQVVDLLGDVMIFQASNENRSPDGFYCLQPIVVKKREDLSVWEVVDGQQRLITLFLILQYFNQRFAEKFKKTLYDINFETRAESKSFLLELSEEQAQDNIDFHFIHLANQTIEYWFADKENLINDFEGALLNRVKVIWYELPESQHAVDAFTRLNVGKIPLTNSELVRALFLRSNNFPQATVNLEQLKIAQEWDLMEKALQNDDFWYFLTKDSNSPNRIELIFNLIAEAADIDNHLINDRLNSFHHFNDLLSKGRTTSGRLWDDVKSHFMTLEEWYRDQDLFHLTGYLINEGDSVLELIQFSKAHGKKSFRELLKKRIWERLIRQPDFEKMNRDELKPVLVEYLENLEYGTNSPKIKATLLLFNIASIIANKKSIVRFRFDYFKKENWDIEHIRSVSDERPSANIDKKPWLEVVGRYFREIGEDKDLLNQAAQMLHEESYTTGDAFDNLYDAILKRFGEHKSTEAENGISNLALLDSGTNRGYKNAVFPIKREWLLRYDQAGTFVPLCTRNVFLKAYSEKVDKMLFWESEDQDRYRAAMLETLTNFFKD